MAQPFALDPGKHGKRLAGTATDARAVCPAERAHYGHALVREAEEELDFELGTGLGLLLVDPREEAGAHSRLEAKIGVHRSEIERLDPGDVEPVTSADLARRIER